MWSHTQVDESQAAGWNGRSYASRTIRSQDSLCPRCGPLPDSHKAIKGENIKLAITLSFLVSSRNRCPPPLKSSHTLETQANPAVKSKEGSVFAIQRTRQILTRYLPTRFAGGKVVDGSTDLLPQGALGSQAPTSFSRWGGLQPRTGRWWLSRAQEPSGLPCVGDNMLAKFPPTRHAFVPRITLLVTSSEVSSELSAHRHQGRLKDLATVTSGSSSLASWVKTKHKLSDEPMTFHPKAAFASVRSRTQKLT